MKSVRPVAVVLVALALAGCSATTMGVRSSGNVVGGFAADSQPRDPISSSLSGGMNGGLIAGAIGTNLADRDRKAALAAEYQALEYGEGGQVISWKGSRSGTGGEVVAGQPYRVGSQDCRQYRHTVRSGADARSDTGAACRNPDGSWTPLT